MIDIKCTFCNRWLGETDQSFIGTIKCSNSKCKKNNNVKIIFASNHTHEQMHYKFKETT